MTTRRGGAHRSLEAFFHHLLEFIGGTFSRVPTAEGEDAFAVLGHIQPVVIQ
jgi:hypothetical protein